MELLFLGTGGSCGVPVIGCHCPICTSTDQRNKRYRTSALLSIQGKILLIDAGPDFRNQALTHGIDRLDGVLLTHAHHDHVASVDELRVYYIHQKKPLPCLLSSFTLNELKGRFPYIFNKSGSSPSLVAQIETQLLPEYRGEVTFLDVPIRYFTFEQAGMPVNGFRFGSFAYVSDIHTFPESIYEDLKGVKTLVLSAVDYEGTVVHFGFDNVIDFSEKVGAEQVWLVHMGHNLDYEEGTAFLPPHIRMAYDGLTIECADGE